MDFFDIRQKILKEKIIGNAYLPVKKHFSHELPTRFPLFLCHIKADINYKLPLLICFSEFFHLSVESVFFDDAEIKHFLYHTLVYIITKFTTCKHSQENSTSPIFIAPVAANPIHAILTKRTIEKNVVICF